MKKEKILKIILAVILFLISCSVLGGVLSWVGETEKTPWLVAPIIGAAFLLFGFSLIILATWAIDL